MKSLTILALLFLPFFAESGHSESLLEEHQHVCDKTFPCPPEMARRIDFWIEIFHRYTTSQLVFHDIDQPERVYSVIDSTENCSHRRETRDVKNERLRLRNLLTSIADRMDRKESTWSDAELQLISLFPNSQSDEIRAAAQNIRCQQGNRDRFLGGLQRFGAYKDHVRTVLQDRKLPEDILYLPFVESSYDPRAYSRLGAAGLWQIMPATVRRLGLKVNDTVDERMDPLLATYAAADYLREASDELEALAESVNNGAHASAVGPFIITSYNYGTAGTRKAMTSIGPDFAKVLMEYSGRGFRTAVRNFYASFLAARYVAKYADSYFGKVTVNMPMPFEVLKLPQAASAMRLAEQLGVPGETLQSLNPSLTKRVWKGRRFVPKGFELRVPERPGQSWEQKLVAMNQLPPERLQIAAESYRVKRGDTPCGIAREFGVSCRDFLDANELGHRRVIRVGQIVSIPSKIIGPASPVEIAVRPSLPLAITPVPTTEEIAVTDEGPVAQEVPKDLPAAERATLIGTDEDLFVKEEKRGAKTIYTIQVEVEETLGHIADWLGLKRVSSLRTLNKLKKGGVSVGRKLRLPIHNPEEKKAFEQKRIDYHKTLEEEFKQHFDIIGQEIYDVKAGEDIWTISRDLEVPIWLLRRFNPDVFEKFPKPGDSLSYPVIVDRQPAPAEEEAPAPLILPANPPAR